MSSVRALVDGMGLLQLKGAENVDWAITFLQDAAFNLDLERVQDYAQNSREGLHSH